MSSLHCELFISQLTTNFSANHQLTTVFLARYQLTANPIGILNYDLITHCFSIRATSVIAAYQDTMYSFLQ